MRHACSIHYSVLFLMTITGNILAQCDQTQCWSEKGYEVSHDQYLKGKFLLTITAVDYSNRIMYTCACDGVDACDVRLIIETLTSSLQLNPGQALVMDLPIPEPVEVMYKARDSADLYGAQICTVAQRSLHCQPEYTHRASCLIKVRTPSGTGRMRKSFIYTHSL
ncbi:uncharacterized protein LOC113640025 [Tachysurus ichikawai]